MILPVLRAVSCSRITEKYLPRKPSSPRRFDQIGDDVRSSSSRNNGAQERGAVTPGKIVYMLVLAAAGYYVVANASVAVERAFWTFYSYIDSPESLSHFKEPVGHFTVAWSRDEKLFTISDEKRGAIVLSSVKVWITRVGNVDRMR
jgi:hypothetical protein